MPDLGDYPVTLDPAEHAALLRYGRRATGMCAVLMCWRKAAKKRKRCEEHLRIDRERKVAARARDGAITRNHSQ
jgi:hypothetical protein